LETVLVSDEAVEWAAAMQWVAVKAEGAPVLREEVESAVSAASDADAAWVNIFPCMGSV
jgi:hypothetical protein